MQRSYKADSGYTHSSKTIAISSTLPALGIVERPKETIVGIIKGQKAEGDKMHETFIWDI